VNQGEALKKAKLPKPVGKLSVLADIDRTAILNEVIVRYCDGEQILEMAPDYGVSDVLIYRYLLAEMPNEFKQAQVSRSMAEFERASAEKDQIVQNARIAPDQLELNRASVLLKCAESNEKRSQWLMERCLSRIYGQEKSNQAPVAIQINLRRDDVKGIVVEDVKQSG
jgi:hypothetical protein